MSSKERFAALEVMCRERAAIAKKEWNTGWQKQRNGSNSGNLLTDSQKDASPRPRNIPDPIINRLEATARPKGEDRDYTPTDLVAVSIPSWFVRSYSTSTARKIGMRQWREA
jgi:hypothetical protein